MRIMQNEMIDRGYLQVNVTDNRNIPIENVNISISPEGEPTDIIESVNTNEDGQTENVELETPPVNLSLEIDNIIQPYAEYTVNVTTNEYESIDVSGIQVMAETDAIQNIVLRSKRIDT